MNSSGLIYQRLPLKTDLAGLRADLAQFSDDEWIPHFNQGYYEGDWSVLPLRAAQGATLETYPDPTATGYYDTERMARCRTVPEFLKQFECEIETVRFMKLGPGDRILEHRDYMTSLETGCARIHVPIETNDGVSFVVGGEILPLAPGEVWYINFNEPHRVTNEGTTRRVHLVIDCLPNDFLRKLIVG